MTISNQITDDALLAELGHRLAAARVARHFTQAALATEAGVSKRTVERLESGEVATQLSSFIRVCRVLGLIEGFELLVPPATPGPMAQLKHAGRARQRVRQRAQREPTQGSAVLTAQMPGWTWDDKPSKGKP